MTLAGKDRRQKEDKQSCHDVQINNNTINRLVGINTQQYIGLSAK